MKLKDALEKSEKDTKESIEKLAHIETKLKTTLISQEKLEGKLLECQDKLVETPDK